MKKTIKPIMIAIGFASLISSCKKKNDDLKVINTQEVITTMILNLTDTATGTMYSYKYKDLNSVITQDTIYLVDQSVYSASLLLLDETKTPIDTVSNEVFEEANEHQFFFSTSTVPLTVTNLDKDGRGLPLGLNFKLRTGSSTLNSRNGILRIELNHFEDQSQKNGTSKSDETDIDVSFKVIVEIP